MSMLSYTEARQLVIDRVSAASPRLRAVAPVSLWDALGFVLAEEISADRDYPPFDRSTRDGYAVRAADAHADAALRCVGELKAGDSATASLEPQTCVAIMTGAGVPPGADAVVMIEHTTRAGQAGAREMGADGGGGGAATTSIVIRFARDARAGQNIVPRASEAKSGQALLAPGLRLGYAELAIAAQLGSAELRCSAKPRVAVLSTGDEIVAVDALPGPFQIRNSNSVSLAAQVRLAGGEPVLLGNAADNTDDLRAKIERGLKEDVLVLSGGVSMGKYDLVEGVLKDLGAEFFFDSVAIRPGKPAVFGRCQNAFVFGLPGNPVSTMVTFQLFVAPAIDILSGAEARPLPLLQANLAVSITVNSGLTHFVPARVEWPDGIPPQVKALRWQGSGDIATLAQANAFLVIPADRDNLAAGEPVNVLLRKDVM
jgi:molybdopterin molybdotransferase